ncbi:Peptidase M15A, C-terminal [uncultured Caudovirales phage]|uniref:Peptidase M15A, C-terminal n=1 Tax=uncultured Caudovirales phage TaxID=2100421 RepID=A0A6J5PQT6_9CAUD|nr:Peptidase M15A, C-terminal [uncultured Caudovirales phage]CAB4182627.1 Peptidase M15A, C-terminal [uncultured Caudovirales phage]CAB4214186.1 Peptidase M15A, C-terminal [uncultured Caudovirales phage]CAB5228293.1 Peptidase M15A, C-terminal [uncultured Caudovirales phage]
MTPHFSLEELTFSDTAVRLGINNNVTDPTLLSNLHVLAAGLEQVRSVLNAPLHINSGYRCLLLNGAVKGSINSAHMQGWAADFTCRLFGTPLEIVKEVVKAGIKVDQIITEGTWVHVSFSPQMRNAVLTAHFDKYGNPTYTSGA